MTELPAEMSKNIGVTARTFGTSTEIDIDRSSWTDLPADRMKGEKVIIKLYTVVKKEK